MTKRPNAPQRQAVPNRPAASRSAGAPARRAPTPRAAVSTKAPRPATRHDAPTPPKGVTRPRPAVAEEPKPGGWGLLSVRSLVLFVVIVLSFAVVAPTVRSYVAQRATLDALQEQVDREQQELANLEAEAARWDDQNYIVAQARERLGYVFPGETPYRVVDPEFAAVPEEAPGTSAGSVTDPDAPWWTNLAASLNAAGGVTSSP